MKQTLIRIYAGVVSILSGVVFVAQILSFAGLYCAEIAIPLSLITIGLFYAGYMRYGKDWFDSLTPGESPSRLLTGSILLSCLVILSLIFLQRAVFWDTSTVGKVVSSDFGGYHSIKAFQLLYEGSNWNLAIPYGQYPIGYESLLTFGMFFTGDIRITGTVHALIVLVTWLTIALLIVRYGKLPIDSSLLLALAICFMPVVYQQMVNVGKNDLLLSMSVLMAILHAPAGDKQFHPVGMALATMVSLATKPSGLYVLFFLWGLVMLNWYLHFRKGSWRDYLHPLMFVSVLALMFPGGLWVIRNYLVMGEIYTSEISSFFQTVILANLNNPYLTDSPGMVEIYIAVLLVSLVSVATLFYKRLGWQMAGILIVIAVTFSVTPLGAFYPVNTQVESDVQWRYVLHGIILLWILGTVFSAPLIRRMYDEIVRRKTLQTIASSLVILAIPVLIYALGVDDIFSRDAHQWEHIEDPTLQNNSIYDELATLEGGVIYLENITWMPVVMRNSDLIVTNLLYPLGHADVYPVPDVDYIAFNPSSSDEPSATIYHENEWDIIFENDTGRIYRRVR